MPELSTQQNLGRAKNAIQEYMIRKLLYPKIYLDADWNGVRVDVLAVDRTGVGDVHAVKIATIPEEEGTDWQYLVVRTAMIANEEGTQLHHLSVQFRYVAIVSFSPDIDRFDPNPELARRLLAEDGVGRIGILTVDMSADEPHVRTALKAERFRSSREIVELKDQFVAAHSANWEMRE